MNDNEYGRSTLRQTADGRSELVVSDKEDLIDVLKENAIGSDGQSIDQIRIVDEENGGSTKKIIYSDRVMQERKRTHTLSDKIFIFAVLAFIIGVAGFLLFFAS